MFFFPEKLYILKITSKNPESLNMQILFFLSVRALEDASIHITLVKMFYTGL